MKRRMIKRGRGMGKKHEKKDNYYKRKLEEYEKDEEGS
jgi:hypothetical protein